VDIPVLANDRDIDSTVLSIRVITAPLHGTLDPLPNGSLRYTPQPGFSGQDAFSYVVSDGEQESTLASVTLTVIATNRPPVAVDDAVTVAEDGAVRFNPLANDQDPDGDTVTLRVVQGPAHGQLTRQADGSFIYTPDTHYSGEDSLCYVLNDGRSDSGVATVRLTVTAVPDAPLLTLGNPNGGVNDVERELFRTGWESVGDRTYGSTLVTQSELEGWTRINQT